jgi:hypothetical protein
MKHSNARTTNRTLTPFRLGTVLVCSALCLLGSACDPGDQGLDDEMFTGTEDDGGEVYEGGDEDGNDGGEQPSEPGEADLTLGCDFSAISGIWVADEDSELPYEQTIVLGAEAETGEAIGYTVFYTSSARLCAFDLTCIPSVEFGSHTVAATLTDEDHAWDCAEGFYEFSQNAATPFHMSYSLDASGDPEFAAANFVRVESGAPEAG